MMHMRKLNKSIHKEMVQKVGKDLKSSLHHYTEHQIFLYAGLKEVGFTDVTVVKSKSYRDPNFLQ